MDEGQTMRSPLPRTSRYRSRSRSASPKRRERDGYRRRATSRSPRQDNRPRRDLSPRRNRGNDRPPRMTWGRPEQDKEPEIPEEDKEKPNFGLSGALAQETNTVKGVFVKYNEPPEARKPNERWRLYVFKGDKQLDVLHIHRQSAYLFGRDRQVADVPIDHPSCSKQHAVIQFRQIIEKDEETMQVGKHIKPFLIDLESTNGTHINGERIPESRYVELKVKDVLKFGESTREYVVLCDGRVDE